MGTWENGFGRCGKLIKGRGEDRQSIQTDRQGHRFTNCNVIRQAKKRAVFKFPENGVGRCGTGNNQILGIIENFRVDYIYAALHYI